MTNTKINPPPFSFSFDKSRKPTECCSNEATRYAIQGPALVTHNGSDYLAATDGRVLSMVTAQVEGDVAGNLTGGGNAVAMARETIKEAGKGGSKGRAIVRVAEGKATAGEMTMPLVETKFPDGDGVLHDRSKADEVRITLNASLLAKLAKGLGAEAVTLHVKATERALDGVTIDAGGPIFVEVATVKGNGSTDGSFGAIMPLTDAKRKGSSCIS